MTRIVLYSDQPILAQGLRSVLLGANGFEIHSICTTMATLMETMTAQQPDIVLMDLTSEVTFGALSEMKRAMTNTKIVLWVHSISTELAFQAMGLGVRGILRKTLPTDRSSSTISTRMPGPEQQEEYQGFPGVHERQNV